ncbi:hypothetical protein GGQ84_001941, partial [Desulfitispora alkaliphila]
CHLKISPHWGEVLFYDIENLIYQGLINLQKSHVKRGILYKYVEIYHK